MNAPTRVAHDSVSHARTVQYSDLEDPLQQVNAQAIRILKAANEGPRPQDSTFLDALDVELCNTDTAAIALAARYPFLLVDCRFSNVDWWREVCATPTRTRSGTQWLTQFPRKSAIALARATLVLAWHSTRTNRSLTAVTLGLSPAVADIISTLSLEGLQRIAEWQFRQVRPRWEERPEVWRQILGAAAGGVSGDSSELRLRGFQLTIGDLLAPTRPPRRRLPI